MKYLFLLLFFLSIPSLAQTDDDNAESEPSYKVHCDCEHNAGTIPGERGDETLNACIALLGELNETDLGGIKMPCEDGSCPCIFSHSVYGFGEDRDSAIENAKTTCAAVSVQTSKEFNITEPDACKDEQ